MRTVRELGSEFWDAERGGNYSPAGNSYLSGRTALTAVILDLKARGIESVSIPEYCCESMIEPFLRQGMNYDFYAVTRTPEGLSFEIGAKGDRNAVLLVNYFGFMSDYVAEAIDLCRKSGQVTVLDRTHSVFSCDDISGPDYCFGSYRKWTGIEYGFATGPDNERLITWPYDSTDQYIALRNRARKTKSQFVKEGYSDEAKRREQLDCFSRAEELLDSEYLSDTDECNKELIRSLDLKYIVKRRRSNASVLLDHLKGLRNIEPVFKELPDKTVPLAVPVLVREGLRDSLRSHLIQKGIFCPVHWPLSDSHIVSDKAAPLFRDELSLICDQRYTEADMLYMMEILEEWEKNA